MIVRSLARHQRSICLFLAVLSVYAFFFPRWADWNQNSRLDLVMALVDDHSFAIDRYVANTGDYALYAGHYYSDKAPGMALLGLPVYAALRALLPQASVSHLDAAAHGSAALQSTLNPNGAGLLASSTWVFVGLVATSFVTGVLPAAILALLLLWVMARLGVGARERVIATLLYALGTPAFAYANSIVGHQTTACLVFGAFALLLAVRLDLVGRAWLFLVGMLLGYAVITEYPAALIVAVLGVYALATLRSTRGVLARLVLGGVLPVVALVVHDIGAFGTPFPVGYFYSALWADVHQTGLISLTYPHLDALLGITIGMQRGLLFLSPYLLLAIVGYRQMWRSGWRAEALVVASAPIVYMLYNSSSAMWSGGFGVGPRYLVASLPFLGLAAGIGVPVAWQRAIWRPLVALAAAWSLFAVWAETIGGQAFPDYTLNPLFDFSLPKLLASDIARNAGMVVGLSGWSSLLPLAVVLAVTTTLAIVPLAVRPVERSAVSRPVGRSATWLA